MNFIKIFFVFLAFLLNQNVDAKTELEKPSSPTQYKINFLPDGTEIKFEGKKIYYVCNHKLKPLPEGLYMLADGTIIKVANGTIKSDRQKYQRPTEKKRRKRAEKIIVASPKEKLVPHIEKKQE